MTRPRGLEQNAIDTFWQEITLEGLNPRNLRELIVHLRRPLLILLAVFIGFVLLIQLIAFGYSVPETGFGVRLNAKGEIEPARTLWDWLQLLIIPLMLATITLWFNYNERRRDQRLTREREEAARKLADEDHKEKALQDYLATMTELLLKHNLHNSKEGADVRAVARAWVLSTLRALNPDSERSAIIIRFLIDAKLATFENPIVDLNGADFMFIDFHDTYLSRVNLSGANLTGASFSYANLSGADLRSAILSSADLSHANLYAAALDNAKMRGANLHNANLSKANLRRVDLRGANLRGTDLTDAILQGANLAVLDGGKLLNLGISIANEIPTKVGVDIYAQSYKIGATIFSNAFNALDNPYSFVEEIAKVATLQDAIMPDGKKWTGKPDGPYTRADIYRHLGHKAFQNDGA